MQVLLDFDPLKGDCEPRPQSPDFAARRVHVIYTVIIGKSSQQGLACTVLDSIAVHSKK